MQCRLGTRGYVVIYAYMLGIYAYMKPGKHIYRPYIYVCHVYMCVFVQVACCIYANECNLMQMYAALHIMLSLIRKTRLQIYSSFCCKVCTTLMMKPIVGQCALYVAQTSICSIYYDLYKSTDWKGTLHVFSVGLYDCTIVLYVCFSCMLGMVLKGS